MTGSNEMPEGEKPQEQEPAPHPIGRKIKTFACHNCGASVELRNPGQSLTVVCSSCHSIIDATDENYRILEKYQQKTSLFTPLLSLGSRADLFGHKWEVIGFVVRKDIASPFIWEEYLLFNPHEGYRWLTQSQGHWNWVRTIKDKPSAASMDVFGRSVESFEYNGKKFKVFDRGQAEIIYVLGEFYWTVSINNAVLMEDFICPPQILSHEQDKQEGIWSIGEYIEPKLIADAFKLRAGLIELSPAGIAPNQPSKVAQAFNSIKKWWMLFAFVLTAVQIVHLCSLGNQQAFHQMYSFVPNTKSIKTTTTPVFILNKDKANVEIQLTATVDNSWFYLSGELVNNDNGLTYSFERSIEYYHGYSDGEYWSEGSSTNDIVLPAVPGGKYYINFDYECGAYPDSLPRVFGLNVLRDVPTIANYLICLLFISIVPVIFLLKSNAEETQRWHNSDFSPYSSA